MYVNSQFLDVFRCNSINHLTDLAPDEISKSVRRSVSSMNLFMAMGQTLEGIRTLHEDTQVLTTETDVDILNT